MIDSTAEREEASSDGVRLVMGFRSLGTTFGSPLASVFNVRQSIIDWSRHSGGVTARIRMSFFPYNQNDREPSGGFLWMIEPGGTIDQAQSLWSEFINSDETTNLGIPELRIKAGSRWLFLLGHNRLVHKAALRIARVLSDPDGPIIDLADDARFDRLNFWPAKCGTRLLT
jgi:hypothetical protein